MIIIMYVSLFEEVIMSLIGKCNDVSEVKNIIDEDVKNYNNVLEVVKIGNKYSIKSEDGELGYYEIFKLK